MPKTSVIAKKVTGQVARLSTWARSTTARLRAPRPRIETVVALDVGSSRIACAVAEWRNGTPSLVSSETVQSYGIRGGEVIDLRRASESIRIAVETVGERANADIRSVVLGFSGDVKLNTTFGTLELEGQGRCVNEQDLMRLRRSLVSTGTPGRRVVHRCDGPFTVGELRGIEQPLGLSGKTLGMAAAFLTVPQERFDNLVRAVRGAGVEIENVLPEPLAASEGALTPDEKALGTAVLDFGAGGFRGVLWEGGRVKQLAVCGPERAAGLAGVVAASGGMEEIVLGLAQRFRIAPSTARRILTTAWPEQSIELTAVDGLSRVRVEPKELAAVVEELLLPHVRALRDGLASFSIGHAGGVVLAGQGARVPGLLELVSRHFDGARVRIGTPKWEAQEPLPPELEGPGGCAISGLLGFGHEERVRLRQRDAASWWGRFTNNLRRVAASL